MQFLDVNVLVYAFRRDAPGHADFRAWLERALDRGDGLGVASIVLSGFLRVVTHPRVFKMPTAMPEALEFVNAVRLHPAVSAPLPGTRHWGIFETLCRRCNACGNVVPDAYLAALAIEHDAEWVTADSGFAQFQGLRVRHPLR